MTFAVANILFFKDILRIKDEGLAWTNDDPKKAAFLLSKAGKGLLEIIF